MDTHIFLIAIFIIFSLPFFIWKIVNNDNYFPIVIVQIVIGIILGPTIFGSFFPNIYDAIFNQNTISHFSSISILSIIIFAMLSGFEVDVNNILLNKRDRFITAFTSFLFPFLLGTIIVYYFFSDNGIYHNNTNSIIQYSFALGLTCSITALPILIIFLEKLNVLNTEFGQRLLQYASLDDIIMWTAFALIMLDKKKILFQIIFLITYPVLSFLINKILAIISVNERWFFLLIWLIFSALYSDIMGFHYIIGAFLSGIFVNKKLFNLDEVNILRKYIFIIFLPFFFLITGLKTIWIVDDIYYVFVFSLSLLLISTLGKFIGTYISSIILNWKKNEFIKIGFYLQTKGLITIVFANVLLEKNIISALTFSSIILMSLLSTILTIPSINFLNKKSCK